MWPEYDAAGHQRAPSAEQLTWDVYREELEEELRVARRRAAGWLAAFVVSGAFEVVAILWLVDRLS